MNRERRDLLTKLISQLEAQKGDLSEDETFKPKLEQVRDTFNDLKSDIETVRDQEQEVYDNLSDNMQSGERGQDMSAAIDSMNLAIEALDEIIEPLEEIIETFDDLLGNMDSKIDNAVSELDNARQ